MRFLQTKKNTDIPDSELLEEYRRSPQSGIIEILFDRYCHLAFAVCMKYLKNEEDSKDAVMHIFERLHEDLGRYRVQNFSHWLYILTRNHCLKELKSRRTVVSLEEIHLAGEDRAEPDEERDFDITPVYPEQLQDAIAELSEEQMRCIRLFYLEEKTYNEIASLTGFSFKQVKSYIQNGKRNLRNYLERKSGHA